MYIVSTSYNNQNSGCIINTVTQITSKDPILSISINKDNYTNQIIKESKKVAITILSEETSKDIIIKFGYNSSRDIDKFLNLDIMYVQQMPLIDDNMCGYIIGDVIDIIDVESHDIFLIRVNETRKLSDLKPMTYSYYQMELKGTSPKNAPTYIEEKSDAQSEKYRCIICGHIYDDSKENIKFVDLPDDWKCPVCGVPKSKFEKIK